MRKGLIVSTAILAAILAFCLWNSAAVASRTARWRSGLEEADRFAQEEGWEDAATVIRNSYAGWSDCQTWLHCVAAHDAVDDAEAMYQRAVAFAESGEGSELRAELADLRDQLQLLSKKEELSIRNIL